MILRRTNGEARATAGLPTGFAPWLLLVGGLVTLAGYMGPWIDHRAAALVVTGLDLGEYVKFLPAVRQGQVAIWREGFYLPLVAVSLTSSFHCYRADLRYSWPLRGILLGLSAVAALNLLPPAWTPPLMLTPEFRMQAIGIALCLLAMGLSPLLAQVSPIIVLALCSLLTLLALFFPLRGFMRALPDIAALYGHALQPGWGVYTSTVGLLLLLAAIAKCNMKRNF